MSVVINHRVTTVSTSRSSVNLWPRRSASALEADGYRPETKSAGIITSIVCALVTELHVMQTYFVTGACI